MVDTCAAEFEAVTPYYLQHLRAGERGRSRCPAAPRPWSSAAAPSASARASSSTTAPSTPPGPSRRRASRASWSTPTRRPSPPTSTPADRLYFEPLDEESLRDILENEADEADNEARPRPIVQFGGQTAINLSQSSTGPTSHPGLHRAEAIDIASDRTVVRGVPVPPGHTPARRAPRSSNGRASAERPGHRLPHGGAPQLRAGRPGHGDRPERDRAGPVHGRRFRGRRRQAAS